MNSRKTFGVVTAIAGAALAVAGLIVSPGLASATAAGNSNNADYWVNYGPHPGALCYKHGFESNVHGVVAADQKSVTLNTFNQSWPGDHWELLVVNAGSHDNIIVHPSAGVAYFPPLNNGGQHPVISHWIVCKGTTPDVTTTTAAPTTTMAPTTTTEHATTTTEDEETTTTEAATTTTEAATTTTEAATTTTEAATTTTEAATTTTEAATTTTEAATTTTEGPTTTLGGETTTTVGETTTTLGGGSGNSTTTTVVDSGGPTTTTGGDNGNSTTTTQVASEAPTTTVFNPGLPRTGSNEGTLITIGLLMVLGGLVSLILGRRTNES